MAADVRQRMHAPVAVAGQDQRNTETVMRDGRVRLRQKRRRGKGDWQFPEHGALFGRITRRIDVG